ncbi:MAG: C39 family peptidase [Bellilinea sp.]|jgi:uncharacterized protein YvpB
MKNRALVVQGSTLLLIMLLAIVMVSFAILLLMMAADYFFYGWSGEPPPDYITLIPPSITPVVPAFSNRTSTPTAFQPLPSATYTSTKIPPTHTHIPTATQEPTPIPLPSDTPIPFPPDSARIEGVIGYAQTLNLSCESRSASDWARFFGKDVSELDFLAQLPRSDDPNKGFVGNPNGPGGLIPPNPYGVHAAPVAALLRAYGIPAEDLTGITPDQLRIEIASGRPVIVWVTVATMPGYALSYTTEQGNAVTVVPNEHTAILIGYDPHGVTLLDGALVYWRGWDVFLQSFQLLGNMAVVYRP